MQTAATRGRCKVMLRSRVEHPAAASSSPRVMPPWPLEIPFAKAEAMYLRVLQEGENVEVEHMSTLDTVNNLCLLYAA